MDGYDQEFFGQGYRLRSWSFFNDNGDAQKGRLITPLIFRDLIDRTLPAGDAPRLNRLALAMVLVPVISGLIHVVQDIRGRHRSEGEYAMYRVPRGEFNTSETDETTDAWDTIDWLVKNVPETNGRVGILGISYNGFLALMALVDSRRRALQHPNVIVITLQVLDRQVNA